jgi:nucleotide-binding universal stress UspA family protein
VQKFLTDGGIVATAELIRAGGRSLAQSILDYSNDNDGDLIMIMTQQESDFTNHFIGSSAQSIIYNADTPVMSVRPVVTIGSIYDLP